MLHQQDGSAALFPNDADALFQPFLNLCGAVSGHVGQAVYYVEGRVGFGQQVEYRFFQLSVARKAEVDDGQVQLTLQDVAPGHARARGAGSLGYRRAVDDNRFFPRVPQKTEQAAFRSAYLQPSDVVVEGQVERIFVSLAVVVAVGQSGVGVANGVAELELRGTPVLPAVAVGGIQVHAAHARGRHVGQRERAAHLISDLYGRGVGVKLQVHSGAVLRKVPYLFPDGLFRPVGQALVAARGFLRPSCALYGLVWVGGRVVPYGLSV